jgi:hypothetical protein
MVTKRRRKTKAERVAEERALDRRCWEDFLPKLKALGGLADALTLVAQGPGPDEPGRHYYSNLGFFLHYCAFPNGGSFSEWEQYVRLAHKMDEEGVLRPGALAEIELAFREKIRSAG